MKLKDFKQTLKTDAKFHIDDRSDRISAADYIAQKPPKQPVFVWDRLISTAVTLVFVFLLSLYVYTSIQPVTVLTIDFNPSLEIQLNRFDRVLKMDSDDAGGQEIIANIKYNNRKIDKVMDLIYDYSVENDFLDEDNAYLLIGVYGEDEADEAAYQSRLEDVIAVQMLFIFQHSVRTYDLGEPNDREYMLDNEENYGIIDSTDSPAQIGDLFPSTEDETPKTSPQLTASEVNMIANTLDISQTKLALVLDIFYLSEDYSTENDLYILAMMDISQLIVIYQSLN